MRILGVHFHTHDTSVVLLENGKVLYAASNERFSRIKMDKGSPILALKNCLSYTKTKTKDIDVIAISSDPPLKMLYRFFQEQSRLLIDTKGRYFFWINNWLDLFKEFFFISGIPSFIYRFILPFYQVIFRLNGFRGKIVWVQHHFCHVSAAYFTSGWDKCLVGIIEGDGYDQSMSFWRADGGKLDLLSRTIMPHSAGKFYELVTVLLGFNPLKHSGKITGLAAYGNWKKAYKSVEKLLWVEGNELRFDYQKRFKYILYYKKNKKLPREFSKYTKEDLAAAFQKRLEDCVLTIVSDNARKSGLRRIALAGGVVANVRLNEKIHELPEVDEIHIHQAMGDDGLAMGAALYISNKLGFRTKRLDDVYFGPDYSDRRILQALRKHKLIYSKERNMEKKVAILLSQGKVVARFNGRMEYGPRALGNRTILYQTTDKSVNKWLNERLVRTEFMPFAPVTLKGFADKCYKGIRGAEYPARFMTITFECTQYMKKVSPAVVHVDNTARPQLISRRDNPGYYKILYEYFKITGIPSLINTSFNMHGEPIVESPDDAIRSFLAGGLDYLAISSYLVKASFLQ